MIKESETMKQSEPSESKKISVISEEKVNQEAKDQSDIKS